MPDALSLYGTRLSSPSTVVYKRRLAGPKSVCHEENKKGAQGKVRATEQAPSTWALQVLGP